MARAKQVDFLIPGIANSSGSALSAGKVYTYAAGTTSNKTCWTDRQKVTPAANPFILDSRGAGVLFADGAYRFDIYSSGDVLLGTYDNLTFAEEDGLGFYASSSSGAANVYAFTVSPAPVALADGMIVSFKAHQTNTSTTPTANPNGLGALTITLPTSRPLGLGSIRSGNIYYLSYNSSSGGRWELINPSPSSGSWTPTLTSQAGTLTSPSFSLSTYESDGEWCTIQVVGGATLSVSTATYLKFTLPIQPAVVNQSFSAIAEFSGADVAGYAFIDSVSGLGSVTVKHYANTVFAIGSVGLFCAGRYKIA